MRETPERFFSLYRDRKPVSVYVAPTDTRPGVESTTVVPWGSHQPPDTTVTAPKGARPEPSGQTWTTNPSRARAVAACP